GAGANRRFERQRTFRRSPAPCRRKGVKARRPAMVTSDDILTGKLTPVDFLRQLAAGTPEKLAKDPAGPIMQALQFVLSHGNDCAKRSKAEWREALDATGYHLSPKQFEHLIAMARDAGFRGVRDGAPPRAQQNKRKQSRGAPSSSAHHQEG